MHPLLGGLIEGHRSWFKVILTSTTVVQLPLSKVPDVTVRDSCDVLISGQFLSDAWLVIVNSR